MNPDNLNWGLLRKLYAIHSPSGKEDRMITFLTSYLYTLPGVELTEDTYGNLYAKKGDAESYPCIVSHMDQVQRTHSKDFKAIETRDIIFGYSARNHQFEGLGADDKNGIFMALQALRKYDCIKAVFFKEEEIGCNGSSHAEMTFFDDCRYVIQCDRRGNSDLISNIGYTDLCSGKFIQDIAPEKWGYKEEHGAMTDVETLKERGLSVSAVNMSCGYYNPHTDEEITVKCDLEKCWRLVQHIIEDCTDVYPHEIGDNGGFGYGCDWEIEDEIHSILEDYPGITAYEIHELYKVHFPKLDLSEIERIMEEHRIWYSSEEDTEDEEIPFDNLTIQDNG